MCQHPVSSSRVPLPCVMRPVSFPPRPYSFSTQTGFAIPASPPFDTMEALEAWHSIQSSESPLLIFAKSMIPTPMEAYSILIPGNSFNAKVTIHDFIPSSPTCYRAFDLSGNKILILGEKRDKFSQGDILHLHRFIFVSCKDSIVSIKSSSLSATRLSRPNQWNFSIELCGGTGSMLDATALIGHTILASVEINGSAMEYSPPRHRTIIGDASSFNLYDDLPDCAILVMGFPCQPFAVHGTGDGEANPKGRLAALGPLVASFLDCPSFILETVRGFAQKLSSQNSLENLRTVASACGFQLAVCETNLLDTWIQTRHRLILAGSTRPLPPSFSQMPGTRPSMPLLPIIDWSSPLSDFPSECWPNAEDLGWIHDTRRTPPGYPRTIHRNSTSCMQIMRSYGTFKPRGSSLYLSQVVRVPIEQFLASPLETQAQLQHQISAYGELVRFLSPSEASLISGILPLKGPVALVWELSGNACCPLLLFEALHLVSPPEISSNFPVRDLRQIWLRKIGAAHEHKPHPVFPAPYDATILLRFEHSTVACRFQGPATMSVIVARIPAVFPRAPDDVSLYLEGDLITPDAPLTAYDLYGKVVFIE